MVRCSERPICSSTKCLVLLKPRLMDVTACLLLVVNISFFFAFFHAQMIAMEMVRMRKEMEQGFAEKLSNVYDEVRGNKLPGVMGKRFSLVEVQPFRILDDTMR